MKTKKTYAVLTRDWTYTNMIGQEITWKKGRRFMLNRFHWIDRDGNLVLENWYAYGCDAHITKDYLTK